MAGSALSLRAPAALPAAALCFFRGVPLAGAASPLAPPALILVAATYVVLFRRLFADSERARERTERR